MEPARPLRESRGQPSVVVRFEHELFSPRAVLSLRLSVTT